MSQTIVTIHHTSVQLRLNIGAKQLIVDVNDRRTSKPLKSVALSDSTNVSIGWISSSIGGSSIRIISITFRMAPSLTSYSCPSARLLSSFGLLAQLCNDFTLLGFGQAGCPKFHPFPIVIHQIRGSRKAI